MLSMLLDELASRAVISPEAQAKGRSLVQGYDLHAAQTGAPLDQHILLLCFTVCHLRGRSARA